MKFSLNRKLNTIMFMQDFKENPQAYKSFAPTVTGGHIGVDLILGYLKPIQALYNGKIIKVTYDNIVQITDPDENGEQFEIMYSHCTQVCVDQDYVVKKGQQIALQGYTGPSVAWNNASTEQDKITWSHLHLSIRKIKKQTPDRTKTYVWDYRTDYDYVPDDSTCDGFYDPKKFSQQVLINVANVIVRMENSKTNNVGNIKGLDLKFLTFNTREEGFDYLCDYITRACTGKHAAYKKAKTIYDFFKIYAPEEDSNNPLIYAQFVVKEVGLKSIDDPINDWLLSELDWLKKYQSTPFLAYPELSTESPLIEKGVNAKLLERLLLGLKYLWNKFIKV